MTEEQLKALLEDMSLEEKVNQMSQLMGGFFSGEIVATGPMQEKGFTPENIALAGSILGTMGAENLKKIQKEYMEKHPHHIRITSPCSLCWILSMDTKPFFRFRWRREQPLNRSCQKDVRP